MFQSRGPLPARLIKAAFHIIVLAFLVNTMYSYVAIWHPVLYKYEWMSLAGTVGILYGAFLWWIRRKVHN